MLYYNIRNVFLQFFLFFIYSTAYSTKAIAETDTVYLIFSASFKLKNIKKPTRALGVFSSEQPKAQLQLCKSKAAGSSGKTTAAGSF